MKKLFQKAETALGVDLDGDGHVGKPKPQQGHQHYQQGHQQQQHGYQSHPPQHHQQAPPQAMGGPGKGNVKALLIGINYYGQQGQLSGCVNDVKTMQNLVRQNGLASGSYQEVILVDDRQFPGAKYPTKQEMLNAFRWLASNNRPGDTLFLHYSGHGGQQKDTSGDEADGYDETLIPVDYKTAGQISDDEVFNLLVRPLPAGVRMTAVMDCCHSGTAMDLPFLFTANENAMQKALVNPQQLAMCLTDKKKAMKLGMELLQGFLGGGGGGGGGGSGFKQDGQGQVQADVVMLSGCGDHQTSADVSNVQSFGLPPGSGPGGAGGACTNSMASVLLKNRNLRFVDLLEQMRVELKRKGYSQVPQLSSSKPIDLSAGFSFFGPIHRSSVQPIQGGHHGRY
eukprot:TRINITY_DN2202_c0_g2_i1.p1 TRINITY_DN2202_c0_g2~~TRINITY_DN2202_c0_g2_i1.p1  ORF type:complete len:396 (+),score=130.25 TRINITY_DN2202_c0_g2_i1:53-1240(+)